MMGGVCIIFLLMTIPYILSAPDPLGIVNINLNLGEGTNTGYGSDYGFGGGFNGNGNAEKSEPEHEPESEPEPKQAENLMKIIQGIDTSNVKRCQSSSVIECQAISINMDALNSPGPLVLPNGVFLTDGETRNLYKHNPKSNLESKWKRRYKPKNSFLDALGEQNNPRVFKTSETYRTALFTIIDGIAIGSIPLKNNMLYTVEHNGNSQRVGNHTDDYNENGQGVGYQLLIKRNGSSFRCDMDKPQMSSGSKWKDRDYTGLSHSDRSSGSKWKAKNYTGWSHSNMSSGSKWKDRYHTGWRHSKFYDYQSILSNEYNLLTVLADGRPKVDISITMYYTELYEQIYLSNVSAHFGMFNEANQGLHESNIPIRFVPHCWIKTNIKEVDNPVEMRRQFINMEPTFRELSKDADAAVLLLGDKFSGWVAQANGLLNILPKTPDFPIMVIRGQLALGHSIFGHEMSHLLGAGHNRNFIRKKIDNEFEEEPSGFFNPFFRYGHGKLFTEKYMTIMSYSSTQVTPPKEEQLNFYSSPNPNPNFHNIILGTEEYEDNARVLTEMALIFSQRGSETMDCPPLPW